jgi:hypothetical protein
MSASVNPDIVTDGLVLCADDKDLMPNGAWKDILLDSALTSTPYNTASWANDIEAITIMIFMKKTGNSTQYSSSPLSKMNTGTGNASFRLYHFHNYQGNSPQSEGVMYWYGTRNTSWAPLAYPVFLTLGETAMIALQYNSTTGGIMWKNITKANNGTRFGSEILGVGGNGPISFINPTTGDGKQIAYSYHIYNRELEDYEIIQNYNALKGRYGL